MKWEKPSEDVHLCHGDCLEALHEIGEGSLDCVVCDPPYPEVDRDYGRLSESKWRELVDRVINRSRRLLKPRGSLMMVLQPNSERLGRMRTWLWEFLAYWGKEWGVVQDVYWWNNSMLPTSHCQREVGLMRPSLKYCVWLGGEDCYRDQGSVLLTPSEYTLKDKRTKRHERINNPSGHSHVMSKCLNTPKERGGSTPFNVLIAPNSDSSLGSAGGNGHGAGTPLAICDFWVKYICPRGGVVLDTFMGSGTVGIIALRLGRKFIGIEKEEKYFEVAKKRLKKEIATAQMRKRMGMEPGKKIKFGSVEEG